MGMSFLFVVMGLSMILNKEVTKTLASTPISNIDSYVFPSLLLMYLSYTHVSQMNYLNRLAIIDEELKPLVDMEYNG